MQSAFTLDQDQIVALLTKTHQSFVNDVLDKLKMTLLDHVCDSLVNCHVEKQIDWDQTVDLHSLADSKSFTCSNKNSARNVAAEKLRFVKCFDCESNMIQGRIGSKFFSQSALEGDPQNQKARSFC